MKKMYSVKEISEILGVSKPTVQRAIVTAAIEATAEQTQKRYYDQAKTAQIIELVSPGFDVSGLFPVNQTETQTDTPTKTDTNQSQQTETYQKETDTNQKETVETETQTDTTAAKALQTAIEALQKELEAKNRQIEAQEGQINILLQTIQTQNDTISGLTESIKSAQALAAGDKLLLLDKKNTQEEKTVIDAQEAPAGETLPDDQEETAAGQPEKKGFFSRLWHNLTN